MPKAKNYTLKYFDGRARGEIIRLLLTSQDIKFKDERFTQESWPAAKPNIKFGQLPVMEIDGQFLSESVAIQRYLAREFGMCGSSSWDVYIIDQILGICIDLFDKFVKSFFEKDAKKKEELITAVKSESVPRYIGNIEEIIKGTGKGKEKPDGFCIGKKLTLGDIAIFDIVDEKITDGELSKVPYVLAIVNNVRNNPSIKTYLAGRKKTDF